MDKVKEFIVVVKDDDSTIANEIMEELKEEYGAIEFRSRPLYHITVDGKCGSCGHKVKKMTDNYCPNCGSFIEI